MTTFEWKDQLVEVLDQRSLPEKEIYHNYSNYREIAFALEENLITGTALRTYAAAVAVSMSASSLRSQGAQLRDEIVAVAKYLEKVSDPAPIAKKIFSQIYAICSESDPASIVEKLRERAISLRSSIAASEQRISALVAEHLGENETILLCSSSGCAISSVANGTLSGAIDIALAKGKKISAFCLESRPDFSGARIHSYDLFTKGCPTGILPDIHHEHLFRKKIISKVLLNAEGMGADGKLLCRSGSAIIVRTAKEYGIPVICACLDAFRDEEPLNSSLWDVEGSLYDVAVLKGIPIVPEGIKVYNFTYDIIEQAAVQVVTDEGSSRN